MGIIITKTRNNISYYIQWKWQTGNKNLRWNWSFRFWISWL